jgi:hypothetical protein
MSEIHNRPAWVCHKGYAIAYVCMLAGINVLLHKPLHVVLQHSTRAHVCHASSHALLKAAVVAMKQWPRRCVFHGKDLPFDST